MLGRVRFTQDNPCYNADDHPYHRKRMELLMLLMLQEFPEKAIIEIHSLKLTASLPLKTVVWKIQIPFWEGICSGVNSLLVLGRVI